MRRFTLTLCPLLAGLAILVPLADAKTVADPRGTVTVKPGEILNLTFRVSGGIGFDWRLHFNGNRSRLRLRRAPTEVVENPGTVGGFSVKTYSFRALRSGRANLVFWRHFRGTIDRKRTVRVVIRP